MVLLRFLRVLCDALLKEDLEMDLACFDSALMMPTKTGMRLLMKEMMILVPSSLDESSGVGVVVVVNGVDCL